MPPRDESGTSLCDKFSIERKTNKPCEQKHTLTEYPIAVGHMNLGL